MPFKTLKAFLLLFLLSCNNTDATSSVKEKDVTIPRPHRVYTNISEIPLPEGFSRPTEDSSSFAYWLRNVPLKSDSVVYLFDGRKKSNQSAQFAVIDISVGQKDLQQCADAVMRLRAEYLFSQKKFDDILFKDNDGTPYHFKPPYNSENLNTFLQRVFGMCGSASLSKQLFSASVKNIKAGNVFIRGGFPGHAVIVMDVAENKEGKKVYLLAQSYMPAQDIHVLKNPGNEILSPWYEVNDNDLIHTPEYTFKSNELKQWSLLACHD